MLNKNYGQGHIVYNHQTLDNAVVMREYSDRVLVRPSVQATEYVWMKDNVSISPYDWVENVSIIDIRDPQVRVTLPDEPLEWFEQEADELVLLSRIIDNIPRGRRPRILAHINAMWGQ